jgi:hypothetical protein
MYAMRRAYAVVLIFIIVMSIAAPALAVDDERYGYITVQDVTVDLKNQTADIHVNYTVDEGTRFIFFLLGKQDLKNKLLKILNYENAHMNRIDLTSADFTVTDAAFSYGNGIFWYPSHEFNVVVPTLTVRSPQATRSFSDTRMFPAGMGYFDVHGNDAEPAATGN